MLLKDEKRNYSRSILQVFFKRFSIGTFAASLPSHRCTTLGLIILRLNPVLTILSFKTVLTDQSQLNSPGVGKFPTGS